MSRAKAAYLFLVLLCIGLFVWIRHVTKPLFETQEPKVTVSEPVAVPLLPTTPKEPQIQSAPSLEDQMSAAERQLMRQIFAKFQTGDYVGTLGLAEANLQRDDRSPAFITWLQQQFPNILISTGWLKLQLNDCDAAIPILMRAETLSRHPMATKGLAYCYYREKNYALADAYFRSYRQRNPDDYDMLIMFADNLESQLHFNEALAVLEQAAALKPSDRLKQRIQSMQGRAKEGRSQATATSRFVNLSYRVNQHEALIDPVLNTLEDAIDELIERYGFSEPDIPIEVVLYPGDNFKAVVAGSPDWAQGIFDGRMRIPVQASFLTGSGTAALERVLRHELVHAMLALRTNQRTLPSWFNEGLAQRFECKTRCPRKFFPPKPGEFMDEHALSVPYTSYNALKAERSYRQSIYLIYAIENHPELKYGSPLRDMVRQLPNLSTLDSDHIAKATGFSFDQLLSHTQQRWVARDDFERR